MVMAQTLFKLLLERHPGAAVDVLAPAWAAPVLARMPEVRRAIDMPVGHGKLLLRERRRLGHALRAEGYDQAILLPGKGAEPALARVLALDAAEDLLAREARNRAMYDGRNGWFWREKRADFRRTALAVLAERRDSGPTIEYAAEYLFRGLDAHAEAIDALLTAWLATPEEDHRALARLEDEIAEGIRHMAWSEKMLVEGSAGLAQAAWQADAPKRTNKVSAVVLCGANFDRDRIAPIIGSMP